MKKRKKSVIGWTYIDWHLMFQFDTFMNIKLLTHSHITNCSGDLPFPKISKKKVRITIEEI